MDNLVVVKDMKWKCSFPLFKGGINSGGQIQPRSLLRLTQKMSSLCGKAPPDSAAAAFASNKVCQAKSKVS